MKAFENKKVLILGANPETAGIVLVCNEMGIDTYVTDYNPMAYAKRFAKHPLNIDATDVKSLETVIKNNNIDGIICGVAESLMQTYAKICCDLKLPCYGSKQLFDIFVDKARFKDICRKNNIPVVDEFFLKNYEDDQLKRVKLPVVVKPVDACSSKGISVCKSYKELREGIDKALSFSNSKRIIIEKYMTGDEVVIYYAFQDGEPTLLTMCDRYTTKEQLGVAQLPTAYVFPSKHLDKYTKETDEPVKRMFNSLNIKNGFMFIQSFIDENGSVRFYEPGYRLNGAQEHYIVAETTGIDAKTCLINYALCGEEADFRIADKANPKLNGKYGCKLSPLAKLGKIYKIVGLKEISKMKNVISINPSYSNGDEITGYGTLKQVVCRFYIVSNTKRELKETIDKINNTFDVINDKGESLLLKKFDTDLIIEE